MIMCPKCGADTDRGDITLNTYKYMYYIEVILTCPECKKVTSGLLHTMDFTDRDKD